MAESLTVNDNDLVPMKHVYPDIAGETDVVAYGANQKFWYWSNMMKSEALLLQCFDSLDDIEEATGGISAKQSTRCAHASFSRSLSQEDGCERQSVEVRCLVLG